MTPEQLRRHEALTAALSDLGWFKIPHTMDAVIGVHAEATSEQARPFRYGLSPAELADALRGRDDAAGYGKGGHSDPTATLALRGEPDATDPDETLPQIDHALDMIHTAALDVGHACSDLLAMDRWNPKGAGYGRQQVVTSAMSRIEHFRPRLEDALSVPGADVAHLDWLVRSHIADTASWLQVKCSNIWDAARGTERPAEQSRRHAECTNCVRHGITGTTGTVSRSIGLLCARCAGFQSQYKCLPDQRIVRAWDRGAKSIPNGWVIERQAGAKIKPGRSRAS